MVITTAVVLVVGSAAPAVADPGEDCYDLILWRECI